MKLWEKIKETKISLESVIIAVIILISLFAILLAFGFKFSYTPRLANDWNAIAAVGQWAGVIISGILTWIIIKQTGNNTAARLKLDTFPYKREISLALNKIYQFAFEIKMHLDSNKDIDEASIIILDKYKESFEKTANYALLEEGSSVLPEGMAEKIQIIYCDTIRIITFISALHTLGSNEEEQKNFKQQVTDSVNEILKFKKFINYDFPKFINISFSN